MTIRLLTAKTVAGYRYGEGAILDLQNDREEERLVECAEAEYHADSTNGLVKENNLSDVPDKVAARGSLGLGALATQDDVYFTSSGGVQRTVSDKLRDYISLKDFGAVGDGVTNNLTAITNAIAAADGRKILVPSDSSGGNYAVTSGSLTLTGVFEYEAGARIYASGGTAVDSSKLIGFGGEAGEGLSRYTRGLNAQLLGTASGSPVVGQVMHHYMRVEGDVLDVTTGGGSKSTGCLVDHRFGGVGAKGGRQALAGRLIQDAVTEATNADRNYTGTIGQAITSVGDGGGTGSEKGAYFGVNGITILQSGATDTLNASGAEFNVFVYAGASTKYRTGIQIAVGGDVRGSVKDSGISIYSFGTATIDLKKGIEFGDPATPSKSVVGTDGTILDVIQTTGVTNFLNCAAPVSGKILGYLNGSVDVNITPAAFNANAANYAIELGRVASSNTPRVDFHSGASGTDYDARISSTGGTASAGQGALTYTAATHSFVGGMKFGTFTSDAAAAIAGYITITDAGGTTRKLLVAA